MDNLIPLTLTMSLQPVVEWICGLIIIRQYINGIYIFMNHVAPRLHPCYHVSGRLELILIITWNLLFKPLMVGCKQLPTMVLVDFGCYFRLKFNQLLWNRLTWVYFYIQLIKIENIIYKQKENKIKKSNVSEHVKILVTWFDPF